MTGGELERGKELQMRIRELESEIPTFNYADDAESDYVIRKNVSEGHYTESIVVKFKDVKFLFDRVLPREVVASDAPARVGSLGGAFSFPPTDPHCRVLQSHRQNAGNQSS